MASTEQLERETEQTRARLAETLEELKSMSPGRVLDEVLDYAKEGGGDLLRGLGRQVSDNPIPAALIGAGIVWMMMGTGKSDGSRAPLVNGDGQAAGEPLPSAANSVIGMGSQFGTKASNAAESVKSTMQSAASSVSETASTLKEKASSAYESVADTATRTKWAVKDAAYAVKDSASALEYSAMAATRGAFDFCKDQPLVLAGLGLAIGAALGAAIPETEAEDRLMGETADQLKEKAQAVASDQLQLAKSVGQHMVDETAKIAKEELTAAVDNLGGEHAQGQNWHPDQSQGPNPQEQNLQSGSGQHGLQTDEQNAGEPGAPYGSGTAGDQTRPIH
jgi:ElaB/YqjD/DUF883 family membrane-anchored ribosome-binding protein